MKLSQSTFVSGSLSTRDHSLLGTASIVSIMSFSSHHICEVVVETTGGVSVSGSDGSRLVPDVDVVPEVVVSDDTPDKSNRYIGAKL